MFRIQFFNLLIRFLMLVPLALALAGCPDESGVDSVPADSGLDTDGDGLTDAEEINFYGTSFVLADTDGDGFSDSVEIVEFGFDPTNNNFKFNPLIADVPKISIELTSVPDIQLSFESTTSVGTTIGTERSDSVATSRTNSTTQTNSTAIEQSHTVGGSTEVETSIFGPKTSSSVSYEYTQSTTKETSTGWTQEQSRENQTTLSSAEEISRSEGINISGGSLRYTLTVKNHGNMSFTLSNLTLSAVMADPYDPSAFAPLGNLTLENIGGFPATTLGPGGSLEGLVFSNDLLNVTTAKKLLGDSSGMVTKVGIYEVLNEDGTSYTHNETAIGAKTATVLVDFGTELEQYLVATNIDPDNLGVSLGSVMRDVLQIPYELSASTGLSRVRDKGTDIAIASSWMVVHLSDDGINQYGAVYDNLQDYDFDGLLIKAGQVVHLVYLEDADGDGLGIREEIFYGTDANNADTDGDGLSDYDEVKTGWINGFNNTQIFSSPIIADLDGDGLNDLEEMQLQSDPENSDTDGDLTADGDEAISAGRNAVVFDAKFDISLNYFVFTLSCDYPFNVDVITESIYFVSILANPTPGGSLKSSVSDLTPIPIGQGAARTVNRLILSTNFTDPSGTFNLGGMIGDYDTSIFTADELRFNKTFNISDFAIGASSILDYGAPTSPFAIYEAPCAGYVVLNVDRE